MPSNKKIDPSLMDKLREVNFSVLGELCLWEIPELTKEEYEGFKPIFSYLGGKYKTGSRQHTTTWWAKETFQEVLESGFYPKKNPFQLHETPEDQVSTMLFLVEDYISYLNYKASQDDTIRALEPSAGLGAISRQLSDQLTYLPRLGIDNYEINPINVKVLTEQGFRVLGADFLKAEVPEDYYDLVVMNPEFRSNAYVDHITKAFNSLKVGGWIVSVVPITFLSDISSKVQNLKELFARNLGQVEYMGRVFEGIDTECVIIYCQKLSKAEIAGYALEYDGYPSYYSYTADVALSCDSQWNKESTFIGTGFIRRVQSRLDAIMKEENCILPCDAQVYKELKEVYSREN